MDYQVDRTGRTSSPISLTATSYIVLGLIEMRGEGTPYDLKSWVAQSVGNFWSVPHSAVYAETVRLSAAGLLIERREHHGRRRKVYSLTPAGREALEAWRRSPTEGMGELRDPGLLKLFFGADIPTLAAARLEAHQHQLTGYERRIDVTPSGGPKLTLEAGIAHEREWVAFWSRLAAEQPSS